MVSLTTGIEDAARPRYGAVKWFGGHNSKTGKENHFGFIEGVDGSDIFLHKREWQGRSLPEEGELVAYFEENKDGKLSARAAISLRNIVAGPSKLYGDLDHPLLAAPANELARKLAARIKEMFCLRLGTAAPEEIALLVSRAGTAGASSLFRLVAGGPNEALNVEVLLRATGLHVMDSEPWSSTSSLVVRHFETEIAARAATLDPSEMRAHFDAHLDMLPVPLLTHLLTLGAYTRTRELGRNSVRVYDYLKSVVIDGTRVLPDYLQASLGCALQGRDVKALNPVLRDIVENLYFKKSLFDKDSDFIDIYERSTRLSANLETFVLYNLFSLIKAGNDQETVYQVFLQRLWEAIISGSLSPEQQQNRLRNLFPPCHQLGPLSCEAVYWPKENRFLCRGKHCYNPQVMPAPGRHYIEFSIYDWFDHYGVAYLNSGQPSSRDFPIKLAGYFNRMREILPLLHCTSCAELMLPNMRYARTEYKEVHQGVVEVKAMAAAYRLTVFHCNNQHCDQYKTGHYINHCVGFGCYHIIDSRVLSQRCSEGRYLCTGCGSCCPDHERSNPAGMCGMCGSALKVYRKLQPGGYSRKYARCVAPSCGFQIGPDDLPARFSRLPAEEENTRPTGRSPLWA